MPRVYRCEKTIAMILVNYHDKTNFLGYIIYIIKESRQRYCDNSHFFSSADFGENPEVLL